MKRDPDTQRDLGAIYTVEPRKNSRRAWWLAILLATTIVLGGIGYRVIGSARDSARAADCRDEVAALFEALRAYAIAHAGELPPISDVRGNVFIEAEGFYPEHLMDSGIAQCPYAPSRASRDNESGGLDDFNDESFVYLPWAIHDEAEGLAFVAAYQSYGVRYRDSPLPVEINGRERLLPRNTLSPEVMDVGYAEDPRAVPLLIEWPDHYHKGATVYFSNGISATMHLGDGFPMTEAFIEALRDIASSERNRTEWRLR